MQTANLLQLLTGRTLKNLRNRPHSWPLKASRRSQLKEALQHLVFLDHPLFLDGLLHVPFKSQKVKPVSELCPGRDAINRVLPMLRGEEVLNDSDGPRLQMRGGPVVEADVLLRVVDLCLDVEVD